MCSYCTNNNLIILTCIKICSRKINCRSSASTTTKTLGCSSWCCECTVTIFSALIDFHCTYSSGSNTWVTTIFTIQFNRSSVFHLECYCSWSRGRFTLVSKILSSSTCEIFTAAHIWVAGNVRPCLVTHRSISRWRIVICCNPVLRFWRIINRTPCTIYG